MSSQVSDVVERERGAMTERSRSRGAGRSWKTVPVTVVLPDCTAYFMELREDCKGFDCLAKMCEVLGIVEVDYFGLKFSDCLAGCEAWVNTRSNLKRQLKKCSHQPYRLGFRVKFFTDANLLQQPSSKRAFFTDLRYRIQRGKLTIPQDFKPIVGALTAQVEIGNYKETQPHSPALVYPVYFSDWSEGIAYQISKEHKKFIGLSKEAAVQRYIEKVCELEMSGATIYHGYYEDKPVCVEVGSRHVHIIDTHHKTLNRIPYYAMTQVSFGSTFFGLQYHCRNDDGTSTDKRLRIMVRNKYIARHIFRETTEQQVFFYQATVLPEVRNHTDTRSRRFRMLFKRATCRAGAEDKEYYFDILRTKHEVYSHVWQVLHQVQGSGERGAGGGQGEGTGAESPYATVTIESDDSSSQIDTVDSNKLYWGLSISSCNLAKDLLAEPHLHASDSETPLVTYSPSSHSPHTHSPTSSSCHAGTAASTTKAVVITNRSSSQPRLNHTQSKKLRQLLLNIQDERLCQVCMSSKISAVFCPCGHHVACYHCAKRLTKCPICRQPIGYVQYVYTH